MTKKATLKLSALAMAGAMSFSLGGAYGLSVQLAVENIANEILESQTTDAKSMLTSYAQQLSNEIIKEGGACLLYTSPSPRDRTRSRMPSSA